MKKVPHSEFLAAYARLSTIAKNLTVKDVFEEGDLPCASSKTDRFLFTLKPRVAADLVTLFVYAAGITPPLDLATAELAIINLSVKVSGEGSVPIPTVWIASLKGVSPKAETPYLHEQILKKFTACVNWFGHLAVPVKKGSSESARRTWAE